MQRKNSFLLIIGGLLATISFSCSSNKELQKSQSVEAQVKAESQQDSLSLKSSVEMSRRAIVQQTELTTLSGPDSILTDDDAVDKLMALAREYYTDAIRLQKMGAQDSSVIQFENSIDVLNDLSYYPDIEENKDFVALSQQIINDYKTYISSVQNLEPGTSVFALQEKLSQIVDSISIAGAKFPKQAAPKTTIPLVMNRFVEQNIEFFTTRGRWHMQNWIYRSGLYMPTMKKIFLQEGLPAEIAYLSMPESGLDPTARSWARAVGLWQFIRSTGNLYGLHSNWWYDERRNPVLATEAAARHLKDLYNYYNNWYLAIAAYNCGTRSVERAIRRSGGDRDFWQIKRFLPRETRNYVPQYIAVTLIAMNPTEYGFSDSVAAAPAPCDTVRIPDSVELKVLAEATGVSLDTLIKMNPELVHAVTPPDFDGRGYPLLVPQGMGPVFAEDYQKIPESAKLTWTFHRVRYGETLYGIARRYRVGLRSLRIANDLSWRTRRVMAGTLLLIPVRSSYYARGERVAERTGSTTSSIHVVRRGETLGEIAARYGTTVARLKRLNHLRGTMIRPRMRLIVMAAKTSRKTVAQAQVDPPPTTTSPTGFHRVRSGETLIGIASLYHVTVTDLRRWNSLRSNRISIGQRLRVAAASTAINTSADQTGLIADNSDSRTVYRVRPGDSLWSIAKKFGVSLDQLKEWNTTAERDIRPGQRITIYN